MGTDCTAIGIAVQPISVPPVCYLAKVEPKDPKDYLWQNIVDRAGVPAGTTQTVFNSLKKRGKKIPRGNLQRIEEKGLPTTRALLDIAKALGVPVWELLTPPGTQQAGQTVTTLPRKIGLEDAIGLMADALGRLAEKDREHMLDTLGRYAADAERKPATLHYLKQELGGAQDQQTPLAGTG